jgi:hypothetical protein
MAKRTIVVTPGSALVAAATTVFLARSSSPKSAALAAREHALEMLGAQIAKVRPECKVLENVKLGRKAFCAVAKMDVVRGRFRQDSKPGKSAAPPRFSAILAQSNGRKAVYARSTSARILGEITHAVQWKI